MNSKPSDYLARIASRSDDPDTQTACFIARHGEPILTAANQMPDGVERHPDRLERPAKYRFIGHAERTVIARAARQGIGTEGCTMYLNWFPCSDCALAIAEAGIATLICDHAAYEARKDDPSYGFAEAMAILSEAGVRLEWM